MRIYSFAPISAREYPTIRLLDHPFIWGGVRFCLNVSEKPYTPELETSMTQHVIDWAFCPVSEEMGADWKESMMDGLIALNAAFKDGKKIVVHCDFGNNRSRSFVEAFHYLISGEHLQDEYKGEFNHLFFNCNQGHLPPIAETEKLIISLRDK